MKKPKTLEDATHLELFEQLIYDENIQDNLTVSNNYAEDEHGNSIITMGFEGLESKEKGVLKTNAVLLFNFNQKGRLVGVEVATKEHKYGDWHVAVSEIFMDMKTRFGIEIKNRSN
jgi:hypothetical protein